MKYIVSAENKPYFYWQLELMVESFKRHSQQSNLIIGLADTENPHVFPINMFSVEVMMHRNLGHELNYLPMNKWLAVWTAMKTGRLQPDEQFVLIDPDMVMVKPIVPIPADLNISAQETFMMTLEHINKNKCHIEHHLRAINKLDAWKPVGLVYVMQHIPDTFPMRVIEWCHDLIVEQGKAVGTRWWPTEMVATNLTMMEYNCSIEAKKDYCCILSDPAYCYHFIHYYEPLQMFDKHQWKKCKGSELLMEPINALLSIDPEASEAVAYMRDVAESYLKTIGAKQ